MTLLHDEAVERPAPDTSWSVSPLDGVEVPPRWTLKTWIIATLIVAATVAAILGLFAWLPSAFASAPGGCGGG